MAHQAPGQLERLVRRLMHPEADIFVHLDRKADARLFGAVAALPGVRFIQERIEVKWGGFSQTEAVLAGLREILQVADTYDFINLLSGADYPIKPTAAIHDFLRRHVGSSFLEYAPSTSPWWRDNHTHFSQYHLTEYNFRGRYVLERLLNKLLPPRRFPLFETQYGGNMGGWCTLSATCAAYFAGFMRDNPGFRRYARHTWGSDEVLLHTVLLNSPLAPTIINNNLRYTEWPAGDTRPKTLTSADLPALLASPRLFARKFDARADAAVLDQLDQLTT